MAFPSNFKPKTTMGTTTHNQYLLMLGMMESDNPGWVRRF